MRQEQIPYGVKDFKTVLFFQSSFCAMNNLELEGACRFGRLRGWNIQTVPYGSAAANRFLDGHGRTCPDVRALLDFWKPAGCIVECAGRVPEFPLRAFGRTPTVFLDRHPTASSGRMVCVSSDADAVADCAARELLSLGFAHYAFLPWPDEKVVWSRERGARFAERIRLNGRDFRTFHAEQSLADALLGHRRQLEAWIRTLPCPCGVFAVNDAMAEQLVAASHAVGKSVPGDIAVVGVDDEIQICENAVVAISSVRPAYERAGVRAAELLERMMADPSATVSSETFGVIDLVRRASSRLIRHGDSRVLKALETIRRRACEGLTPADVVAAMGCSRRLADLRFREATGHTLLDEIHEVRLRHVKDLLRRPGVAVAAIPAQCGYASLVDLRRVFRRRVGCTMRVWRDRHAG